MEDRQRCGIFYNCDEKYYLSHKCKEHKLFQINETSLIPLEEITPKETLEFEEHAHTMSTPKAMELEV